MKKSFYSLLIFSLLLIAFGCEKENEGKHYSDLVTEGVISFKLNGEPMEFQVNRIEVPLAYVCEDEPNGECYISLSGANNQWEVVLWIYRTKTGQFNCEDDVYVITAGMGLSGSKDLLFLGFTDTTEYCTLNISTINNLSLTDKGSPGRLGKIQGTFEFTKISSGVEYVLTDGYFSASKN